MTLVAFGDYECSYCSEARGIVSQLQGHFGEHLRYVFRNYPLIEIHPRAMACALVVESAIPANFWALHSLLYQNKNALDDASLIEYAVEAGIVASTALAALNGATSTKVERDIKSGNDSDVHGTPAFFINGRRHEGDWSLEALAGALRRASNKRMGSSPASSPSRSQRAGRSGRHRSVP